MSAPLEAARELLDASSALGRAVGAGDPALLEQALARRISGFERLRRLLGGRAPSAEVRALVERVLALDGSILAAARSAGAELGRELEALAAARRAARAFRAQQAPEGGARFVERRV
jgi:hypothetical protein